MKAVTHPTYSVFTLQNDSAQQHVDVVSPGKLGAVMDTALWKDVDRKVARLIITVENTAFEGGLKDLVHLVCRRTRLDIRCEYRFISECV